MSLSSHIRPCHRTGNCCRGRGVCTLTPEDTDRIAAHLGLSVLDFRLRYTHDSPRGPVLRIRGGSDGDGSCIFLGEDAACAVQAVKPRQCVEYPLWEHLYADADAFARARSECGMIGHLSHAEFRRIYAASQSRTR
jgi:Fe-S-cluster containining protein